jgi:hypothetical protein
MRHGYKGLAPGRSEDETPQPLIRTAAPLTMEAELAPTVPKLLDRLADPTPETRI